MVSGLVKLVEEDEEDYDEEDYDEEHYDEEEEE